MTVSSLFPQWNDIDADHPVETHAHTNHTDGMSSVAEIAKAASAAGLMTVVLTDHVRKTSTYFPELVADVANANNHSSIELVVGAEAKVCDFEGSMDCSAEIISRANVLVGSVHRPCHDGAMLEDWKAMTKQEAIELEMRMAMGVVERSPSHVLGHPMGMTVLAHGEFPVVEIAALARACAQNDKAFELNPKYCPCVEEMVGIVQSAGCRVAFGSDAHKVDELGSSWRTFLKGESS